MIPRTPPLRQTRCRRCGQLAEAAGAAYCDPCRPERTSDALMTDVDRTREAAACPLAYDDRTPSTETPDPPAYTDRPRGDQHDGPDHTRPGWAGLNLR